MNQEQSSTEESASELLSLKRMASVVKAIKDHHHVLYHLHWCYFVCYRTILYRIISN